MTFFQFLNDNFWSIVIVLTIFFSSLAALFRSSLEFILKHREEVARIQFGVEEETHPSFLHVVQDLDAEDEAVIENLEEYGRVVWPEQQQIIIVESDDQRGGNYGGFR